MGWQLVIRSPGFMSHNGPPAWPSTCSPWTRRAVAQAVWTVGNRAEGIAQEAWAAKRVAQDFLSFLVEGNTNTLNQTAPTTEGSTQTHQ